MNAARRKKLADALQRAGALADDVEAIASDEREAFDALPEGLQEAERGQAMSDMADALDELAGQLREAAEWSEP